MSDLEKHTLSQQESPKDSLENPIVPFDDVDTQLKIIDDLAVQYGVNQRRLMFKLDLAIVTPICFLYLLAFLDRVNISNANVYGMAAELGLTGNQYNVALTVFFVPYILFEIPSNILLKKLRPHVWLSFCMLIFGAVTIGQGFVQSLGGLVATRFFLGLFEAGMFPGCFYLLSMWYRRDEAQKRYSFFFSSTCLAGAFGGLIAYGIKDLDGSHGIAGWRWVFIIEGTITAAFAFILFFAISDFPEDAKFLKENEREFLKAKLALDVGKSVHDLKPTTKDVLRVFKEWKIWLAGLMYFGLIIPAYGYAYFSTVIVKSLGYTAIQTQLRTVPPWVAAFGWSMFLAFMSDKTRHKFGYAVFSCCVAIAGFIMLLVNKTNMSVRYGGCFLIASGLYAAMPLIVCWTNMNFAGHLRKSVSTGWQVGFGNIGGIIATFSFLSTDAPFYVKGLAIGLAFSAFTASCCSVYFLGIRYENNEKIAGRKDAYWQDLSAEQQLLAGDLNPRFRYSY